MAWIRKVAETEANGLLGRLYQDAVRRAGRVFEILKIQSVNPSTLQSSMALYQATTRADSPVSRALREAIAVVVSKTNSCHY